LGELLVRIRAEDANLNILSIYSSPAAVITWYDLHDRSVYPATATLDASVRCVVRSALTARSSPGGGFDAGHREDLSAFGCIGERTEG
jgi:hypothetical protein